MLRDLQSNFLPPVSTSLIPAMGRDCAMLYIHGPDLDSLLDTIGAWQRTTRHALCYVTHYVDGIWTIRVNDAGYYA